MLCIGHRGAMGHEPENTLLSIKKALELGATWIEIDVYYVDQHLIVIHDTTLERTTNGKGYVADQSFEYLRSLDAGKGQQIPTLEEVFSLTKGKCGVNVELKGPDTARPVKEFLDQQMAAGLDLSDVLVSSFDHRQLAELKKLNSEIPIAALLEALPIDDAAFGQKLGAYSVNVSCDFIDQRFVEDAHKRGLKVYVYTVNRESEIRRMFDLKVDGIFTNYPERVLNFKV